MFELLKDIKQLDKQNEELSEEIESVLRRIENILTEKSWCFICGKGVSEHKEGEHSFVSNLALQTDIEYVSKEPFYVEKRDEKEERYFLAIRDKQILVKIIIKEEDSNDEIVDYMWLQNASHKIVRKIIESGALEKLLYELSELLKNMVERKRETVEKLRKLHGEIADALQQINSSVM